MSDPTNISRRLVAVFAADVEGHSRLMGADEVGTLKGLTERRAILDRIIGEHRGRIANTAGDSVLAEFGSAVEAVQCAVKAQTALAEANADVAPDRRISFRIGVHIGDVMVRAGDLFGDGVNIAARLQSIAKPGTVCISGATYDQVRKVLPMTFVDLGVQPVKNIQEPVRAYQVSAPDETQQAAPERVAEAESPPPMPDKPSIAVLPFQNMSGDPEQEYFADGMVEEITTALSRFKWLFVIARNSSFTFKGKAVDVKEVGRRLGVRYVLEGSVRKAAGKVRITGQLIDAVTGAHIWADRFERDLTDVFALQDEVTVAVVSAIQPKLLQTEIAIATRRRPENLTAYDFFLRAMQRHYLTTREGLAEALRLAHRALELDPRFGLVAALAGVCHMQNVLWGYAIDPQFERKEAVRLLRLALSIDDSDPETLAWASSISAFMVGDCESEIEMADRAVALNPNSFNAWNCRGWVYKIAGLPEEAIRSFERAVRMSPVDPQLHLTLTGMGMAFIELRRFVTRPSSQGRKPNVRTPPIR
jgi:adenylate cyclase